MRNLNLQFEYNKRWYRNPGDARMRERQVPRPSPDGRCRDPGFARMREYVEVTRRQGLGTVIRDIPGCENEEEVVTTEEEGAVIRVEPGCGNFGISSGSSGQNAVIRGLPGCEKHVTCGPSC